MSCVWNIDNAKAKNKEVFSSFKSLMEKELSFSTKKLEESIKLYSGISPNLDAAIKLYLERCSNTVISSLQKISFCEEIEDIKVDINHRLLTNKYSLAPDIIKVLSSKCATSNEIRINTNAVINAETDSFAKLSTAFASDTELSSLHLNCLSSAFAENANLRSLHYESCDEIFEHSIVSSIEILDNHVENATKIRDCVNSRVGPTLGQCIFKSIGCDEQSLYNVT